VVTALLAGILAALAPALAAARKPPLESIAAL